MTSFVPSDRWVQDLPLGPERDPFFTDAGEPDRGQLALPREGMLSLVDGLLDCSQDLVRVVARAVAVVGDWGRLAPSARDRTFLGHKDSLDVRCPDVDPAQDLYALGQQLGRNYSVRARSLPAATFRAVVT